MELCTKGVTGALYIRKGESPGGLYGKKAVGVSPGKLSLSFMRRLYIKELGRIFPKEFYR